MKIKVFILSILITFVAQLSAQTYEYPVNVIEESVECYNVMPTNIPFGIREKFRTVNADDYRIDGFSSPLVGDLNGDGKPEIVMMGVTNGFGAGTHVNMRYINIYNGQDGSLICRHDFGVEYRRTGYAPKYHRAPTQLVLADVDNDNTGEIIVVTYDGNVRCYKPAINPTTKQILNTNMTSVWTGNIGGTAVSYTAPLAAMAAGSSGVLNNNFGHPHPYIADLNGDGIAEIIVYNKIFNAQTGALLMSWQNGAPVNLYPAGKQSSVTATNGLYSALSSAPTSQANAAAVRAVAMTGRRPGNGTYADMLVAVPAVIDIDGDGRQEIICGNRIHKFQFNSLTDHEQNYYTTIEGPEYVDLRENPNNTTTRHYLTDGFTRVADIDGDGNLEVIVTTFCNNGNLDVKVLMYVWDPFTLEVKAASTFWSNGANGNFGIPFIGDINGKSDGWDGTAYTKKLPEICMIMGSLYRTRATGNGGRSGLLFHPLADTYLRNGVFDSDDQDHVIGITYDAQADNVDERLKLSWAMEHDDTSNNTGMTLFDFDNNNTADICYRDQTTLRVISPARGNNGSGRDYVDRDDTETTPGTSIMFRTAVFSGTGFEYPTIADVNMDGSADIIIPQSANGNDVDAVAGYLRVFEHNGPKWAPCPPVWNQGMYDPTQVREDLKINAHPQPMLTPYLKNGETIYPYNGSWIQQPIVKAGEEYMPVVRLPDVVLREMTVKVLSTTSTDITLVIYNNGEATIAASAPIAFYDGGELGDSIHTGATFIETQEVGVDIFRGETDTITYHITGHNFNNHMLWARVMDDGNNTGFPVVGYEDCNPDNNTRSDTDCPYLNVKLTVYTSEVCATGQVQLVVTDTTGRYFGFNPGTHFTWYKDSVEVQSGSDSVYQVSVPGTYYCFVEDGICSDPTQQEFIVIPECPDNISNADCFGMPLGFEWSIMKDWQSTQTNIATYVTPVVGDLNGDSIPEIMVARYHSDNNSPSFARLFDGIYIYWGHDRSNPTFKPTMAGYFESFGFSVAKAKINHVLQPVIVMFSQADGYLYAYDPDPSKTTEATSRIWRSSHPLTNYKTGDYYNIGFVDFDGDGEVEVYAGECIFDASTGILLTQVPEGGNKGISNFLNDLNSAAPARSYHFSLAADVNNEGKTEYIAGTEVYSVNIVNRTDTTGNSMTLLSSIPPVNIGSGLIIKDGISLVADINQDGRLDVVVLGQTPTNPAQYGIIAWDVQTQTLIAKTSPIAANTRVGIPFIGNTDNEPNPEILVTANSSATAGRIDGFRLNNNQTFNRVYTFNTTDDSGMTGITLFDFNQDSIMELVYRDMTHLRIMQANPGAGTFSDLQTFPLTSGTALEYPVIADVNNDGAAEIVVTGGTTASATQGAVHIYKSGNQRAWASARKVWNQYAYNVVNVNEDLTIPQFQLNPATVFAGSDGVMGTSDDVRPYNAFLQQQTSLNANGNPVWLLPDVYPDPSLVSSSVIGDSVNVTVGIVNQGDALIGSPVYVTLYKESVTTANKIRTDSASIQIMPGDTGYVTVRMADITPYLPMLNIIARVNDDGTNFPYQPECDDTNNETAILNPAINLMMKKDATLEGIPHNGTYANPVSVLFSETIEYTITAVNANTATGNVIIRDTLPPYLGFVSSNPAAVLTMTGTIPQQAALDWIITNIAPMGTTTVSVKATPQAGSSFSQPMFINRAWVTVSDTITVPTNATYHQGASVGLVTFSAGSGGNIYNAEEQALDYKTTPRTGIVIVPNEGYRFTGWSHENYTSLRGHTIKAENRIMQYDTLTVYGNVNLQANFELEEYAIEYHLNGGVNAEHNPPVYTIESGTITLKAPEKTGDLFTGWTGFNGEKPQPDVTIPTGSTGELELYANFLHSGREKESLSRNSEEDKIWAVNDELYIRTQKTESVVRVYSAEGILQKQQTIRQMGETKMKLQKGIYVITLNNNIGKKIIIE